MAWGSSNRQARLPRDWKARRRHVLERDGYRCCVTVNGVRCKAAATEVHHIREGGRLGAEDDSYGNLISICEHHHQIFTQQYAREQKARKRKKASSGIDLNHPGFIQEG